MEPDTQPRAKEAENLLSTSPECRAATPPFPPSSSDGDSEMPQDGSTYELDDEVRGAENAGKGVNPFARVAEVIYDSYVSDEAPTDQHEPMLKPQENGEHLTSLEPASSPQLHPRTHSMLHSNPAAGGKNSNASDNSNAKPFSVFPGEIPDNITKTTCKENSTAATYEDIVVHMTTGHTATEKIMSLSRTAKLGLFRDAVHRVQNKSKLPPKHDLGGTKAQPVGKQRSPKPHGKSHFVDSATRIPSVVYGEVQSSEIEKEGTPASSPSNDGLPSPSLFPRTASMLGSDSADVGILGTDSASAAEDIYDDIIVYKMQKSNAPVKPKIAPKPAHLQQLLLRHLKHKGSLQPVAADDGVEEEDVYDDIIITAIQKQRLSNWSSFEDVYDDIIIKRLQKSKPSVPQRPASIDSHPKVVEIRRLRKQKLLEAIEEIYDLDPVQLPPEQELEEIYVDSDFIDSDDTGELPDIKDTPTSGLSDVLQKDPAVTDETKLKSTPAADLESRNVSETYQELVIYEELRNEEDDGYQDIEKARIEALGLPDNIRNRACRIVKGPERKKLKKRIKSFRSLDRRKDRKNPATPIEPAANNEGSPPTSGSNTPDTERKPESEVEKEICSSDSSEEEESHDGYMSRGKARQVLDMLLEANNVKKIPHMVRSQSVSVDSPSQQLIPPDEDSDIEGSTEIVLPPEVKEYQEAGILYAKTKSDIAAEIKSLTASAPSKPPPLPGVQRERARPVSRDSLALRQNVLKRTNTLPRMHLGSSKPAS